MNKIDNPNLPLIKHQIMGPIQLGPRRAIAKTIERRNKHTLRPLHTLNLLQIHAFLRTRACASESRRATFCARALLLSFIYALDLREAAFYELLSCSIFLRERGLRRRLSAFRAAAASLLFFLPLALTGSCCCWCCYVLPVCGNYYEERRCCFADVVGKYRVVQLSCIDLKGVARNIEFSWAGNWIRMLCLV